MRVDDNVTAEFFRNMVLNNTGGEYHYTSKYVLLNSFTNITDVHLGPVI